MNSEVINRGFRKPSKTLEVVVSVFFILLFLFPQAERNLHILHHDDDTYCEANEQHFHQHEHSCPVCKFVLPDTQIPNAVFSESVENSFSRLITPYHQFPFHNSSGDFVSLRAPPVFC